jgi:hypothetical protein
MDKGTSLSGVDGLVDYVDCKGLALEMFQFQMNPVRFSPFPTLCTASVLRNKPSGLLFPQFATSSHGSLMKSAKALSGQLGFRCDVIHLAS